MKIKIVVLDYASVSGGAKVISRYFNKEILKDTENKWYVFTSALEYETNEYIKNLKFPWIKKSLIHRYYFEKFHAQKLLKEIKPDVIISLQNLKLNHSKIPHVLYIHQALPFYFGAKYKMSTNLLSTIKYKIMAKKLLNDTKEAKKIIVQTKFMKELIHKYNENVTSIIPNIFIEAPKNYEGDLNFFTPTNALAYKRLDFIVEISRALKNYNFKNEIYLTVRGNENKHIASIKETIEKEALPVKFLGNLTREEVIENYKNHALLFTSEVESLGLPLLEAMHYGTPIFSYQTDFSKELLENYEQKVFFDDLKIERTLIDFLRSNHQKEGQNINSRSLLELLKTNKLID